MYLGCLPLFVSDDEVNCSYQQSNSRHGVAVHV